MNPLKIFMNNFDRTPVIPLMGFPGIQLTGVSIKEALFDPQAQINALLALGAETRPDALFTMMDLTVEAQFLGCELKISDNDPPAVAKGLLEDADHVEEIFENKVTGGRMPLFAEVAAGVKKELDIPVGSYVIGPFTLACEIMGINRVMKATRKNPDMLHQLLSYASRVIMDYIRLLENAGADLICILEPSAMMISPVQFEEFSGRYCQHIIREGIKQISILHICGDTSHLIAEMEKTGPDALSLDKQVNFPNAHQSLQHDTVLIGNVDPVSVVTFGDADSVKHRCRELLDAMQGKENFILSTGCDVPPNAPMDNIKAMIAAVK